MEYKILGFIICLFWFLFVRFFTSFSWPRVIHFSFLFSVFCPLSILFFPAFKKDSNIFNFLQTIEYGFKFSWVLFEQFIWWCLFLTLFFLFHRSVYSECYTNKFFLPMAFVTSLCQLSCHILTSSFLAFSLSLLLCSFPKKLLFPYQFTLG